MTQATELIAKQMAAGASIGRIWGNLIFNVKDTAYGAIGNGTTDDTAAIQSAFDAAAANKGTVAFPPGTYLIKSKLNVNTGVKAVIGYGDVLLNFQNVVDDIGINISGVTNFTYQGIRHTQKPTLVNPAMWVANSTNVKINNCTFETTGSNGIGLSLCTSVWIENNYFTDTGRTALTSPFPSKPAIWVGESPTYTNTDIHIRKNRFYNTNWSAIYYFAVGGTIDGNDFNGCRESTIFADGASHIRITRNKIVCGAAVNSANFGIEYGGGLFFVISDNDISNAGESAIALKGAQYFAVENNLCINNGIGLGAEQQKCGILIREYSATGNTQRGVIRGNVCKDTNNTGKKQLYGLGTYRDPAAGTIQNLIIEGNDFSENATSSVRVWDQSTFLYDTVRFRNNLGYAEKSKTIRFTTTTGTGYKQFIGFGFRPSFVEIYAYMDATDQWCRVTFDTTSSGVGNGTYHYGTTTKEIGVLQVTDNLGNIQTSGGWDSTSLLNDGFQMNFTSAAAALKVVATCYP